MACDEHGDDAPNVIMLPHRVDHPSPHHRVMVLLAGRAHHRASGLIRLEFKLCTYQI